jgi:hypothetical protein
MLISGSEGVVHVKQLNAKICRLWVSRRLTLAEGDKRKKAAVGRSAKRSPPGIRGGGDLGPSAAARPVKRAPPGATDRGREG